MFRKSLTSLVLLAVVASSLATFRPALADPPVVDLRDKKGPLIPVIPPTPPATNK